MDEEYEQMKLFTSLEKYFCSFCLHHPQLYLSRLTNNKHCVSLSHFLSLFHSGRMSSMGIWSILKGTNLSLSLSHQHMPTCLDVSVLVHIKRTEWQTNTRMREQRPSCLLPITVSSLPPPSTLVSPLPSLPLCSFLDSSCQCGCISSVLLSLLPKLIPLLSPQSLFISR